jgi:transcriptional regulator with XRE-family HTH domain
MPQRELAERVSIDPSLISMIESGKREPTREILERIADALEIPFHLFTLLATEPNDLGAGDSESLHRLAVGLGRLLLSGGKHGSVQRGVGGREAQHSVRKPAGRSAEDSRRKTA